MTCAAATCLAQGGAMRSPSLLGLPESGPLDYLWGAGSNSPNLATIASADAAPQQPVSLSSEMFEKSLAGESCDDCLPCGTCCDSTFYARAAGLIMGRDEPNEVWLSFISTDPTSAVLGTRDARSDFEGGAEITFGWRVGCNERIEATYWTLDAAESSGLVTDTVREVSTSLNLGSLTLGGQPLVGFFDNAWQHRITRRNEFHNVELNWLYSPSCCGCGGLRMTGLAGVRFFRFDEGLLFGAASQGFLFNMDPTQEAFYDVDVENNLVGVQVGGSAEYFFTPCVSVYAAPKVGVYNNHIRHHAQIYRGDNAFSAIDIRSSRNDVAILAQLDLGLNYQINNCWSVYGGYRVVAASGMALSDDQIPQFLEDVNSARTIDAAGSLILHGGFAGAEYRF
jgi:hypothetical protein